MPTMAASGPLMISARRSLLSTTGTLSFPLSPTRLLVLKICTSAVIDILQPYNMRKQLEHNLKGMVHDKQAISVCPPTKYASRFLHFISTYIE